MNLLRPTAIKRVLFFIIADILISLFSLYFSYALRFNFTVPHQFLQTFWLVYFTIVTIKIFTLYMMKVYFTVWRFFSLSEVKKLLISHLITYTIFVLIYLLFKELYSPFPRSVVIMDFFLSLIFLGALRASKRIFLESKTAHGMKPTLLIGKGSQTAMIIQSGLRGEINYYPEAIVSTTDDAMSKNTYIHNIKIYPPSKLEELALSKEIKSAILTENLSHEVLRSFTKRLNDIGIQDIKKIKLLGDNNEKLEDLSIEDLLARHPKDLDSDAIKKFISGKRILITGAGGSIGSEIAMQCERFGASYLTLVDHSEYNLYQIKEKLPNADVRLISITNKLFLEEIFTELKPEIVIHAAAYKHVPLCEYNPESSGFNNVLGSKLVIDLSVAHKVEKVVVISTDKAVRPTNIMGATKRVTELYAQNVDSKDTEIVAVRFGNVLGSSGSVIPKFKKQIEDGGPVTVTHPEINRYFMLISEACQLVLQTAAIAKGGELFVLDMGEPVKIMDLAKQMIKLYGKENEIDIEITGLRPGEKLYEELLLNESDKKTKYSSIFIANPTKYDIVRLKKDITMLLAAEDKVTSLQRIVPEFQHEK